MNYASQANTPRPAALLGALAVPLGVGALLTTGLAVTYVLEPPEPRTQGVFVTPKPIEIPPPPPEPNERTQDTDPIKQTAPTRTIIVPKPIVPFTQGPAIPVDLFDGTITDITPVTVPTGIGDPVGPAKPKPAATGTPKFAVPRNNPGRWVTDGDYRSRWINEGLSGVAGFSLEIDRNGRVSECSITRSTGHAALDGATCRLLERRARFEPARNGKGEKITGTYSSSVSWEIP